MVQLSLGLDQKQNEKSHKNEEVQPDESQEPTESGDKLEKEKKDYETVVNIDEILASVGLDPYIDDEPKYIPTTMHWAYIRRVATLQVILSMLCVLFVVWTAVFGGVNGFRFIVIVAALYLAATGLIGRRGGRKHSYCYMVIYFVLVSLQCLLHCGAFFWLIFKVYTYERDYRNGTHESAIREHPVMYLNLGEALALMGTWITGFCGFLACSKGFGRLLVAQDKTMHEKSAQEEEKKPETVNETDNEPASQSEEIGEQKSEEKTEKEEHKGEEKEEYIEININET